MKVLVISTKGEGLGLGLCCKLQGHSATLHTENRNYSYIGEGILEEVTPFKYLVNSEVGCIPPHVDMLLEKVKPDVIYVDGGDLGRVADYIKDKVIGGSLWSDCLNISAGYQSILFKKLKLKEWSGEDGTLLNIGAWWNGSSFVCPFLVYNYIGFMNDDLGPDIGSAGNVMKKGGGKLWDSTLFKFERFLKKTSYKGIVNLNIVLTDDGSMLVSSINTLSTYLPSFLELYKGDLIEFLLSISANRIPQGTISSDYVFSLLVTIPPFPTPLVTDTKVKIEGIDNFNLKHIYMYDVCREEEEWMTAGTSGKVMVVSARGRDLGEASRRVQKTLLNVNIRSAQYRTDIPKSVVVSERLVSKYN